MFGQTRKKNVNLTLVGHRKNAMINFMQKVSILTTLGLFKIGLKILVTPLE